METLTTLISPIMIRRTKDCKIDGEYIVTLPNKDILTYMIRFSPEENNLYRQLKQEIQYIIDG